MECSEKEEWKKAIQEELNSMKENNVWTYTDKPATKEERKEKNIIDSRWVFKSKIDSEGKKLYKARLVIRGFKDKREYELRETYAPVSSLPLIRAAIAIANKEDYDLFQMDVKMAFLNGEKFIWSPNKSKEME